MKKIGKRRAGQLHLPAGLKRNGRLAARKADDVFAFHHRRPAESFHALIKIAQAVRFFIADGFQR